MVPSAWVVAAAVRATRAFVIGCQVVGAWLLGWLAATLCLPLLIHEHVDTADQQEDGRDGGRDEQREL